MHCLNFPAGSTIRLDATARADVGVHRWDIRVLDADAPPHGSTGRLTYGSQIGAGDCHQRVDIPAQDTDCRLEVCGRHAFDGGWKDDRCTVEDDTPGRLLIGFSDRALPFAHKDDVLLSFTFQNADRQP
jgi:hypothetical protein